MRTIYGFFVLSICILLSACSTFPYSLDSLKGNSSTLVRDRQCHHKVYEKNRNYENKCIDYISCVKNYIKNVYERESIDFYYETFIYSIAGDLYTENRGEIPFKTFLVKIVEDPQIVRDYFKGFRSNWKADWAVKGAKFLLEAERSCRHHLK